MTSMFSGFAAIIIIGFVAFYGLSQAGYSSANVFSSENVRLD